MKKFFFTLATLFPALAIFGQLNVTNVLSNSNGTLANIADDYVTFTMSPVAPVAYYVDPYTYAVTATQGGVPVAVTMSDGTAANNVRYAGYLQHFRLQAGTAGKGNVVITVNPAWGSFPNTVETLTDPGATAINPCNTSGAVTYRYQSPTVITDAKDWQALIPKFNVPGKTLTGVNISCRATGYTVAMAENRSAAAAAAAQNVFIEPGIRVAGTINTMSTLTLLNTPIQTMGAAVNVPATGAWPGDNMTDPAVPSTLLGMEDHFNLLSNSALSYLDPRQSPQWITNILGITATADDDILVARGTNSIADVMTVPAASISAFTGTGNAPILLRSLTGFSITGGGGNSVLKVGTTVSFELEVTYTYTSAPCQPVSGSVYLDKDGSANGINNQGKFTGATAMGLKAVLVDADGIVVDVMNVDATGNYSFPNIAPATGYTVRITTQSGIETGRSAPVPTLGTGADYVYVGELNGTGTGNDGNPDGISASFDMGAVPMTQVNFAINSTTVLSADFADLFAKIKGSQLLVNFTTLEEVNNDHFDVEVSNDGANFKKIGEIKSKAINGTSKEVLHYDFNSEVQGSTLFLGMAILILSCGNILRNRKHKSLLLGIFAIVSVSVMAGCSKNSDSVSLQGTDVFVRIAQVDTDGTKTYSKVMKAINE